MADQKPKRYIVRWDDEADKRLLLAIQWGVNETKKKLPWHLILPQLDPKISEGAVLQHLTKIRSRLVEQGVQVPPPLRRGVAHTPAPQAKSKTITTSRRRARRSSTPHDSAQHGEGSDGDGDYDPDALKIPTLRSKRERAKAKAIKREGDRVKVEVGVAKKSTGRKRKRQRVAEPDSHTDAEDDVYVARNASYLAFAESDDENADFAGIAPYDSAVRMVVLRLPHGYRSEQFPLGLAHWAAGEHLGDLEVFEEDYNTEGERSVDGKALVLESMVETSHSSTKVDALISDSREMAVVHGPELPVPTLYLTEGNGKPAGLPTTITPYQFAGQEQPNQYSDSTALQIGLFTPGLSTGSSSRADPLTTVSSAPSHQLTLGPSTEFTAPVSGGPITPLTGDPDAGGNFYNQMLEQGYSSNPYANVDGHWSLYNEESTLDPYEDGSLTFNDFVDDDIWEP
ncbi:MAG: hypothetical protein M1832_001263 [Thelocarpon impressellum]|nr:MAG: hypothetical protein M1832_001263 [Thelocarpon impressellum]